MDQTSPDWIKVFRGCLSEFGLFKLGGHLQSRIRNGKIDGSFFPIFVDLQEYLPKDESDSLWVRQALDKLRTARGKERGLGPLGQTTCFLDVEPGSLHHRSLFLS